MATTNRSARGRLRTGERAQRERQVVAAALDELIEHGYDRVTMLGVASRAGASKETLYNWFGSKDGLFAALIIANADESARRVQDALDAGGEPHGTLVGYATGLLTLLTGPASLALNRAAMSSPELATVLLTNGRHRVGPLVEGYLADLAGRGELSISDPAEAFELLYGLVVRDTQIRCLLGDPVPSGDEIRRRARTAIDEFLALTAPPTG